jgi:hypothetical protein
VKRVALALGVVLVALTAVQTAAADRRTVGDARRDFKGSHWPGPAATWSDAEDCWRSVQSGECGEFDYFENLGGLLDITSAAHGHDGSRLMHRLTVSRRWNASLLSSQFGGQISFYFDTDADPAFERRLDVTPARRGLIGTMRNAAGRSVGRAAVTRPNGTSVAVAFAPRLLGNRIGSYEWLAFAGIRCRRQYDLCGDRSPRAGLITHRIGGSGRTSARATTQAGTVRAQAAAAAKRAASRYVQRFGITLPPRSWAAHCGRVAAPRTWRCHVQANGGQCSGYVRLRRNANGSFTVLARNIGCGE